MAHLRGRKREGNSKTWPKKCQHHQHKIMTLALCSFDEVNQSGSVGEGLGQAVREDDRGSVGSGFGIVRIPPVAFIHLSNSQKTPNPEPPKPCQLYNHTFSLKRMAKALLQRVMHWVNKATATYQHITTHLTETGLEMQQNVRAVKGGKNVVILQPFF